MYFFLVAFFLVPNLLLSASADLGAKREIFRGLSTVHFSWDVASIYVLRSNAEAIVWDPLNRIPFVSASQVGQGRVVVFASWNFFIDKNNDANIGETYRRLATWASRGTRNTTVDHWEVKSRLNTATGTFHIFTHGAPYNAVEMQQLINAVKSGRMNLVISIPNIKSDTEYLLPLLKEAGISIPRKHAYVGTAASTRIPTADLINCPIYSVEEAFPKLSTASDDYFLCTAGHTFTALSYAPEMQMSSAEGRKILDKRRAHAEAKAPTLDAPIRSDADKKWTVLYNNLYLSNFLMNTNLKAPKVSVYPGEVDARKANPMTVEITVEAKYKNEIHATGYYLPAGSTATVELLSGSDNGWSILVGCWTDTPTNLETWTRYPYMRQYHSLKSGKIFTAYGGSVQIVNDDQTTGTVKVRISNVIEAPYMNLRDANTIAQWDARLARSGSPWTDIVGDMISFCLPTSYVQGRNSGAIEYMIRNVWDYAVKMQFEFKGEEWRQSRRERIVLDISPAYGYAHAGYPIVAYQNTEWAWSAVDRDYAFKTGAWGTCHELGHNRQSNAFTWSATGETTNNIFSLLGRDLVFKLPSHDKDTATWDAGRLNEFAAHIRNGAPYKRWTEDAFTSLAIYAQFAKHFGWGIMSQWMQTYTKNMKEKNPTEEKDVIDQWAHRMNQVTGMDLMPLFDFWNIPVSNWVRDAAKNRPCFLPVDWITTLDNRSRYRVIEAKYMSRRCQGQALKTASYTAVPDVRAYHPLDVKISVSSG